MFRFGLWTVGLIGLTAAPTPAGAADLSKIDRTIKKELPYTGTPKYCLLVFGPEAKTRVWLVLDEHTLYIDRYADGDLTHPDDRLPVYRINQDPPNFLSAQTRVFLDVLPPGDPKGRDAPLLKHSARYTRLWVSHSIARADAKPQNKDQQEHWERLRRHYTSVFLVVDGRFKCLAHASFAERPQDAPILHFDGPLTLGFDNTKPKLVRSREPSEMKVCLLTPGIGRDAVVTMDYHFAPERYSPVAEIEFPAKESDGKPIKAKVVLKERC